MAKLTKAEQALMKKLLAQMSEEDKEELLGTKESTSPQKQSNFKLGKRPNTFEKSPDFTKHKADTEIDKKLWGNNEPENRSQAIKVEAECSKCGRKQKVNPIFAYEDIQDRKRYFTCDNCERSR